ncbi:hypothetical protein JFT81_24595 [Pseudomonas sp. TH43]|uniref:hypothetical protein n=1 Tax=Pseudomonas sp. TH43 TaxID=2796407 RepID=UPI00191158F5|nr:hypothetical protein [Pseudomonas sp. TH43]MBK5377803.1 hypothetical protein [Pseudomonas sp. TH43]
MAELEIHFMGLLMPKVGMRSGCNIPCTAQAAFFRPLYFGARMSHQSVGTLAGKLRAAIQMHGISRRFPPNGDPEHPRPDFLGLMFERQLQIL